MLSYRNPFGLRGRSSKLDGLGGHGSLIPSLVDARSAGHVLASDRTPIRGRNQDGWIYPVAPPVGREVAVHIGVGRPWGEGGGETYPAPVSEEVALD